MMNNIFQIEKLDDSNYESWSVQMRSVLVHGGFWHMVSGKIKRESAAGDQERAKWDADDEKALASIILSVKPTQLSYVKNAKTSSEAWEKLRTIYQPKGPIQKVSIYKSLISLKMKEGTNVQQHLKTFGEVAERMAESGIEIQEELLSIMLLCSLPKDFDNFVIVMETRDSLPTLNFIKQKLLEEAERRKEKIEEEEACTKNQAFTVRNTEKYKKQNYNKKSFKGKCYNCNITGHFASQCEKKKKQQQVLSMLAAAEPRTKQSVWYVDSGATAHMCNDKCTFIRFEKHNEQIALAGNKFITATGKGDVHIQYNNMNITLENVLYSSELQSNFISVTKIVDRGLTVKFEAGVATVRRPNGVVVFRAKRTDNMFAVKNHTASAFSLYNNNTTVVWHNRFGHLNYKSLGILSKAGVVPPIQADNHNPCRTCMMCKIHVLPFPDESKHISSNLLECIHSDVCGPFRTQSIGGAKFFVTFIDDKSRRIFVYFMRSKNEVLEKFKQFKLQAENETGRKIVKLRTDNGKEYINNEFEAFLQQQGIQRQLTVPYTPQQNGVAERCNRTLIEMSRSMLFHAGVQQSLWAEAVSTAAYIRNRCPTRITNSKTPFEVWYGRQPTVKYLRTFGSIVVALDKTKSSKFEPKGKQFIMVGYSAEAKAYRLFDKKTQQISVHRDVLFDEKVFDYNNNNNDNQQIGKEYKPDDYLTLCTENIEQVNDVIDVSNLQQDNVLDTRLKNLDEEEDNTADEDSQCESQEECEDTPKIIGKGRPRIIRNNKPGRPRKQYNELNSATEMKVPQTVEEALSCNEKDAWLDAMKTEFTSLEQNKTWTPSVLPEGHKAIACKWVFSLKRDREGNVERHKARLVAKGCNQRYGYDYLETFSPVVRYSTIRTLLALAVEWKMHLHQIDVSTAYLNSELHDEIYIKQPKNFENENYPSKVLRLNKALYGLKQSGREWNSKLDTVLKDFGFQPTEADPCLYKKEVKGNIVLVAVYVDDLIIACRSIKSILSVKKQITSEFDVHDNGPLHHFLGMEIDRCGELGAIKFGQTQYIKDMLKKFGMDGCKPLSVPLDAGYQPQCLENCTRTDKQQYQSIIGTLMYLAITTRPDILHSVCKLAQCCSDPHKEHLQAVKHILRYLAGTAEYKLSYTVAENPSVCGYVDADWGGDISDRKSYTGFSFFVGNCLVSWESRKQNSIALSSTEAEYMAASEAAKEAVYTRKLLIELGYSKGEPVTLYIDNQGAQKLATNPVYHRRSKHVDIKYHHIRDVVRAREIALKYCPTHDMVADVLTKNLSKIKHKNCLDFMNII